MIFMRLWASLVAILALAVAMLPGEFCLCDGDRCGAAEIAAPAPTDGCGGGDDACGCGGEDDAGQGGCAPSCAFACLQHLAAVEPAREAVLDDAPPTLAALSRARSLESANGADLFHPPRP